MKSTVTFPSSWHETKLGDLLELSQNGYSARQGIGTPTVVLRLADVSAETGLRDIERRLVPMDADTQKKYQLLDTDILFIRVNGSKDIAGRAVLYSGPSTYTFCDHFIRVRPRKQFLTPQFLTLALQTAHLRAQVTQGMVSSAGQHTISQETVRSLTLPLPPIREQERLSSTLSNLQSRSRLVRDILSGVPALIDRLRAAILAAAFRGDLTADWRARNPDVEPADKLLERIRAERRRRWEAAELARLTAKGKPPTDDRWKERYEHPVNLSHEDSRPHALPSSWSWATFDEISTSFDHKRVPLNLEQRSGRQGPFPYYGASGIIDHVDDYLFDGNYLLIAEDGANLLSRSSPIAFPAHDKFWVNNHAHIASLIPPVDQSFLEFYLNSIPSISEYVTGTAQPKLTQKSLARIPIPVPPQGEFQQLLATVRSMLAPIHAQTERLEQLQTLLEALNSRVLAKAFRGELVPQDPNDEPASILLERLRAEAASDPVKPGRRTRAAPSETGSTEPAQTSPSRSRKVAAGPAPSAPPAASATQPPSASRSPIASPGQQPLPLEVPAAGFLELSADAQADRVHAVLLGEGPLEREDAVRRAAERLRDAGLVAFQRLRRDGPLATCIDAAISAGLRDARFDRPAQDSVRAVAPEPAGVPAQLWRRALLAALASPLSADEAIRVAADWCQTQFGLAFKRLRTGGHIDTALRAALAELLAEGAVLQGRDGTVSSRSAV